MAWMGKMLGKTSYKTVCTLLSHFWKSVDLFIKAYFIYMCVSGLSEYFLLFRSCL